MPIVEQIGSLIFMMWLNLYTELTSSLATPMKHTFLGMHLAGVDESFAGPRALQFCREFFGEKK